MPFSKLPLATTIIALSTHSLAQSQNLEEMVVVGEHTQAPLTVTTDPKAPRQPLPAHDGADYLKTLPGFSVIRKGGTSGDAVFRGMAGSRLLMSIDGATVAGGCSNRMDPPTAYVSPESFDRITLIKGPQSVQHGPGNAAGVVLFERDTGQRNSEGWDLQASALGGSFGRRDLQASVSGGSEQFFIEADGSQVQQDNYQDGDGNEIHSQYHKWSGRLAAGWTPDENTLVQIATSHSDGEAAYADRGVDGSLFDRQATEFKFHRKNLAPWFTQLTFQANAGSVDHVMDNYTLRTPQGMMANPMAMNPSDESTGAKLSAEFLPADSVVWLVGADWQHNQHANRQTMNQNMLDYRTLARVEDAEFEQRGLFTELTYDWQPDRKLAAGFRVDDWQATDQREQVSVSMMLQMPNPSAGETRNETLSSGFVRLEQQLEAVPATAYVGLGRVQRFPDYWELISKESTDSVSAFNARPETNHQLDLGLIHQSEYWRGSVSAFYNQIEDYLLIQNGVMKPGSMMGMRAASITRNVDARSWGLEADGRYALTERWSLSGTLAAIHGENDTDETPLAQMPPLELRLGSQYQSESWSVGALWRWVAEQDRVDPGKGNIAGQDIGPSEGFQVFSFNGQWKPGDALTLSAGVDNLLNKTYAEHISRAGTQIPGFEQTTRVNEPGRNLWLKAQLVFN